MKEPGLLLVISGPSGSGKGTLCSRLLQRRPEIVVSVSATTRERRAGEIEGKNYYYISQEEFASRIREGLFLEYAQVFDQYYGTPRDKVLEQLQENRDVILEIDIQGAMQVKKAYSQAVFIFIVPPSMQVLKERIMNRDRESIEEIERRLRESKKELTYIDQYDYVIINDKIETAVDKLEAIILAEKCRSRHISASDIEFSEEELR